MLARLREVLDQNHRPDGNANRDDSGRWVQLVEVGHDVLQQTTGRC